MPSTRTSHNISNVEIEGEEDGVCIVRFNWHTLSHRYKANYTHFGMSRYVIDFKGEQPRILNKYVVLKNDYINQVIDIYHI
jgi:benzoate/toluate 1,2-dioxygenase beta subunit